MNEGLGPGVAVLSSGGGMAAARRPLGAVDRIARASLFRLIDWCIALIERRRQRRFLATLSDHALRDIGLSRAQVSFESEMPCWRLGPTRSSMPSFPPASGRRR